MVRIFHDHDQIEEEVKALAPEVVYKYRTWADPHHQRLIKEQQVYFSHPFDLNDELDIRPDTAFDLSEVNDPRYLDKLLANVPREMQLQGADYVREQAAEQWEYTKSNPQHIIDQHNQWVQTRSNFDPYGVFSTGMNPLNTTLWEGYSDNYSGFVIGFHTPQFCREMECGFGTVEYSDDPYFYSFLDKSDEEEIKLQYLKKTSWQFEEEFRFITLGIGAHKASRVHTFTWKAVADITLGHLITPEHEEDILKHVPASVPIYKTRMEDNQLVRDRIR